MSQREHTDRVIIAAAVATVDAVAAVPHAP